MYTTESDDSESNECRRVWNMQLSKIADEQWYILSKDTIHTNKKEWRIHTCQMNHAFFNLLHQYTFNILIFYITLLLSKTICYLEEIVIDKQFGPMQAFSTFEYLSSITLGANVHYARS